MKYFQCSEQIRTLSTFSRTKQFMYFTSRHEQIRLTSLKLCTGIVHGPCMSDNFLSTSLHVQGFCDYQEFHTKPSVKGCYFNILHSTQLKKYRFKAWFYSLNATKLGHILINTYLSGVKDKLRCLTAWLTRFMSLRWHKLWCNATMQCVLSHFWVFVPIRYKSNLSLYLFVSV